MFSFCILHSAFCICTIQMLSAPKPDDGRSFTFAERAKLALISFFGYWFVRLIGSTLRYEISAETEEGLHEPRHPGIFAVWHRCEIPAAYPWRNQRFAVLTSRSFD